METESKANEATWIWRARFWIIAVLLTFFSAFALWLTQAVRHVHEEMEDSGCQGYITQLASQLLWFHEFFGCLPPPFISDENGKPLYSWRVLVLASFAGGEPISDEFDYSKPWDDPINLRVAQGENALRLRNLACPAIEHEHAGQANYFYALNADDRWPRDFFIDPQLRPKILLVESQWREVHWSEPVDFVFEGSGKGFLKKLRESNSPHPGGFNSVTSDWARLQIPGSEMDRSDRLTLTFFPRSRKGVEREDKEKADALVAKLVKAFDDPGNNVNNWRRPALLYLAELGPRAAAAVPEIRRIMNQGDARLDRIAAFALAKIEK